VFAAAVVALARLGPSLGALVAKPRLGPGLSRPGGVGRGVPLLEGSVVSIGRASGQPGTAPPIYACVRESVDDEHVVVQINNNRPNSFSFRVPAGFRATQLGIPTSAVMTQIIAYDIATKVQGADKQYLTSTATVAVEVPVGALDTRIAVEPDPLLAWLEAIAVALPLIVQ